jgi:transcriptional regulator with XRE-family HTH domain
MSSRKDAERGQRIRALREGKGLTQRALADQVGVSQERSVYNWEHGEPITYRNVLALSEALGTQPDFVLEGRMDGMNRDDSEDPAARRLYRLDRLEGLAESRRGIDAALERRIAENEQALDRGTEILRDLINSRTEQDMADRQRVLDAIEDRIDRLDERHGKDRRTRDQATREQFERLAGRISDLDGRLLQMSESVGELVLEMRALRRDAATQRAAEESGSQRRNRRANDS